MGSWGSETRKIWCSEYLKWQLDREDSNRKKFRYEVEPNDKQNSFSTRTLFVKCNLVEIHLEYSSTSAKTANSFWPPTIR